MEQSLSIGANERRHRALPHRAVCEGQHQRLFFADFIRDSHDDCAGSFFYSLLTPLLVPPPQRLRITNDQAGRRFLKWHRYWPLDFFTEIDVSVGNSGIANDLDVALRYVANWNNLAVARLQARILLYRGKHHAFPTVLRNRQSLG